MKTMDNLTENEVEQLSTRVAEALVGLLPEDTIFVIVLGGRKSHRATLSNVAPELLAEVFCKAEAITRRDFIENN